MTCTLMGSGVKQRGKSINIFQESGFPVTKNYWLHFSRHLNSSRITIDSLASSARSDILTFSWPGIALE